MIIMHTIIMHMFLYKYMNTYTYIKTYRHVYIHILTQTDQPAYYNINITSAANVANVGLTKPLAWVGKREPIYLSVNKILVMKSSLIKR